MSFTDILYNAITLFGVLTPIWRFVFSITGLLTMSFTLICFILIVLVLIQASKSSTGVGFMSGHRQNLFGGSGGQEIFQRATWILIGIFMGLSFIIAVLKVHGENIDLNTLIPSQFKKFLSSTASQEDSQKD